MPNPPSGGTLTLAFPAHCEQPQTAIEKWLLGLWQASTKHTWSLFRSRSTISLEYVSIDGKVSCQIASSSATLAELSRSLLVAHLPGLELQPAPDWRRAFQDSKSQLISHFRLRSPGWVDLPKPTEPDAIAGIISALRGTKDEAVLVQLLLSPTWMKTEDGSQPAFWFAARAAVGGCGEYQARARLLLINGAFGQFAGFNGLKFQRPRRLHYGDIAAMWQRRWPRRVLPSGQPMTPQQVSFVFHPPAEPALTPGLNAIASRRTPSPVSGGTIALGHGLDGRGSTTPIRLQPQDLLRHALVMGPSGSGKTTFLANLAHELARAGHGVTVLDPHGSLVRTIARQLPAQRKSDGLLFRFSDFDYPLPINPLRARHGREFLAADELIEILQRVQGREYWGPLLDLLLRHAALASIELGGSLIEAARLLEDPWFRRSALERIANHQTSRFLGQLTDSAMFDRRVLPAINRFHRLLATPWLRNVLGQSVEGIDYGELMTERRLALFDLSGVGTANARLLGSLLLLLLRQATLERRGDGGEPMHFVLIDEASWFLSKTVAELLDQARKFGVGIVVAVQRVGQLAPEDVREAVLANTGSTLSFRIGDREEAQLMARHFGGRLLGTDDLQQLPRFQAYWQTTRDGDRLPPAWLELAPPIQREDRAFETRALLAARERYARPRHIVEAEIASRERDLLDNLALEEPEVRSLHLRRLRFLPTPRDRRVLEAVRTHGRLTSDQIRRLFFRAPSGRLVSKQAVNTRLHKLSSIGLIEPLVVNGGHGSGPYAYGLGASGRQLLSRMSRSPRGPALGAVWHLLEIAEFRVRLQEQLERGKGELAEWVGEAALRSLLYGRKDWPVADALVHWRLRGREGTFLLEWDRGTETLAVLTAKFSRYLAYWRARGHHEMLPGLGLRPRLVIVLASSERETRLAEWINGLQPGRLNGTVFIGLAKRVLRDPMGRVWWRSDTKLSNNDLTAA